jgi:cytochrome c-type biogenesis protein
MEVGVLLAFGAGFLTFFAGCLLPILPAYLSYLGGLSTSSQDEDRERPFWLRKVFINSLFFSFGFITIFVTFGLLATTVGNTILKDRHLWQQIGGVILILLGLYNLELIPWARLFSSVQFRPPLARARTRLGAFILGLTFGFAWTPCIGPTLGAILIAASLGTSKVYGIILLLVFGLGLASPFIILGLVAESFRNKLSAINRWSIYIRWFFSIIIIIIGVLMLTGHISYISSWFLERAPAIVI